MQLTSHTLGLLDVIPTMRDGVCRDLRARFEVRFHHRTVKDFLLTNPRAREFIASVGWEEQSIRLFIARGLLRHLVFEAARQPESSDGWFFGIQLSEAFHQLVAVEELTGKSQSQLMHSLDRYILAPPSETLNYGIGPGSLASAGGKLYSIDPVAMAARAGMWRYIHEILDLDDSIPSPHPKRLSDDQQYRSTKDLTTHLLEFSNKGEHDTDLSRYRERMSRCLSWTAPETPSKCLQGSEGDDRLLATYLLHFCEPIKQDEPSQLKLIKVLLQAGADPMAVLKTPSYTANYQCFQCYEHCFWACWLMYCFTQFRRGKHSENEHDIWQTTRLLLASGSDINFDRLRGVSLYYERQWKFESVVYKCDGSQFFPFQIDGKTTAMYLILTCFGHYPECQAFATTAAMSIKRPWREMHAISKRSRPKAQVKTLYLHDQEKDLLWDLIEAWEETDRREEYSQAHFKILDIWIDRQADIRYVPRLGFDAIWDSRLDQDPDPNPNAIWDPHLEQDPDFDMHAAEIDSEAESGIDHTDEDQDDKS